MDLRVIIEFPDGSPSRQSKRDLHMDEIGALRELLFRVATGEYAAVYVTRARPLDKLLEKTHGPD